MIGPHTKVGNKGVQQKQKYNKYNLENQQKSVNESFFILFGIKK